MTHTPADISHRIALLCNTAGEILQRSACDDLPWLVPLQAENLFAAAAETERRAATLRWRDLTQTQRPFQLVIRYPCPAGEVEGVLLSAFPWLTEPESGHWMVVAEPISNTALDTPHEVAMGRAVLDSAVDAIITITHAGIIHSVNPAASRMFRYAPEDLLGQNVSRLMPEPWASEHDGYLAQYLQTGRGSIIGVGRRVTGLRSDGSEFPIHLAVSEFSVAGRVYFTGMVRDLTELEQVQSRLLQSERLAAIGQMVTGLAHESRNALQRAQGCLDILSLDLESQPEQLDLTRRAAVALQQLHRLYEEVRGYAAPIHLEFRESHLSSIWRKEWEHLSQLRTDLDMELIENLPPADGEDSVDACEIDVHRMEQVFRNILENAVHACDGVGAGKIRITCRATEFAGKQAVRVAIADNGPGMTDAARTQIFEPFFTTKQKGTGLGMAIVHRIIDAHGGHITADRIEPRGTEIAIILPRHAAKRNTVRSQP